MPTWKVAGLSFDHSHIDGLLDSVHDHPDAEVVGLCDDDGELSAADIDAAAERYGLGEDRLFRDPTTCLEETEPDLVVLCPRYGDHAEWIETVALYDVPVLLEKAFAASLEDADRIIDAMERSGNLLAVNWPLYWVESHRTTMRVIDDGAIGDVVEIHYYDGNEGTSYPGPHPRGIADTDDDGIDDGSGVSNGWFYSEEHGGGSLLDYLGYGATLGTWFRDGELPIEVTAVDHVPDGLEVDEQSVTIARYEHALSTFQTRWGTFSHPWEHQPQPKCGFVVVGERGTISSYDYADTIRVQTDEHPDGREIEVDSLESPESDPIEYVIHCLETGEALEGPLSPELSRKSQQIVETAQRSIERDRTVSLVE